ncbi:Homeodomain-like protein [Pelagophyceae sp. CCMP2097]|nr:Homeodomain-like protein [Pelagophyceae sp. CCMP2097]
MRGAFERPRRRWTKSEDERLRRATSSAAPGAAPDWAAAARAVESRSAEDCEQRWHRVLRSGLVKGAFTEAEDEVLLQCMQSGPKPSWLDVSKRIAGRTGKQCRERWTNHVDPNLNKGGWTADEDSILASAHERWGNAWTRIAMLLPGRAENTIKNRWCACARPRGNSAEA